jgi:hypothetical protein
VNLNAERQAKVSWIGGVLPGTLPKRKERGSWPLHCSVFFFFNSFIYKRIENLSEAKREKKRKKNLASQTLDAWCILAQESTDFPVNFPEPCSDESRNTWKRRNQEERLQKSTQFINKWDVH